MLRYINDLGIRIQLFRKLKSFTQAEVDDGLGKYKGYTSSLERGKNTISASALVEICRLFDISETLFLGVDTEAVIHSGFLKHLDKIDVLHRLIMFDCFRLYELLFKGTFQNNLIFTNYPNSDIIPSEAKLL